MLEGDLDGGGRVARDGDPGEIVEAYYSAILGQAGQAEFDVDREVGVKSVAIVDDRGDLLPQPTRGEPFRVQARVVASSDVPHVDISMQVFASDGSVVLDEAWSDQEDMPQLLSGPGEYVVDLRVPQLLPSGDYILGLWLGSLHKTYFHREALRFSVQPNVGDRQEWLTRRRVVQPEVSWSRWLADGDQRDGM